MSLRDAALLLLGHGSTLNADSSAPTCQHAEEIRRRGIFAEVHVAFWKEEPNFRQALRQAQARQVYVVPNFISSGYFTEQVIPRELGLDGPVTHFGSQEVCYCQPVGLSPAMTGVLLARAREVVAASRETPKDLRATCLFICGHGTSLNDNSTRIIHEQAEIIRARKIYGDCQPVLMEQRPFVKDWRRLTDCPDVIVVPFFISDGLHSFEDIPVLLGMTHNIREKAFINPHREGVRRLWYATAIGTEASIADVIVGQAVRFEEEHRERISPRPAAPSRSLDDELAAFLAGHPAPWLVGQVAIRRDGESFHLLHGDDLALDPATLWRLESWENLRELIRLDSGGEFRPLRAAPNLRRGWIFVAADAREVRLALDYLYPVELANWMLAGHNALPVTPWSETAERQSGRFRVVRELDETAVLELAGEICEPGCLKRRLWPPAASAAAPVGASEIPLLCPEACNYFVGQARAKLKGEED